MDTYELENGEVIYPLFSVEINNVKYLLYSNKDSNITEEDIWVAEECNDELVPLSEYKMKELSEHFDEILEKVNELVK